MIEEEEEVEVEVEEDQGKEEGVIGYRKKERKKEEREKEEKAAEQIVERGERIERIKEEEMVFTYCSNVMGRMPTPQEYTPTFVRIVMRKIERIDREIDR